MRRISCALLFISFFWFLLNASCCFAEPVGFHWYSAAPEPEIKEQTQEKNLENKNNKNPKKETAAEKLKKLRAEFRESLSAAILDPSEKNIRHYLVLSNLMSNQASDFTIKVQQTLLLNPDLNYSIEHPSESQARNIKMDELKEKQVHVLQQLSTHAGFIYFYRGHEALDATMAKTVIHFSREYHISLLGVSVDDQLIPGFDKTVSNPKEASNLGIHYFPALILIDTQTEEVKPVFYGFLAEDELQKQLFYVATDFKRWW